MMDILRVGMLHYDSFAYHLNFDPNQWGMSITSITPDSVSRVTKDSFDVVVTTCEYDPVSIDMVRQIKALGIPVLLVLDGVLEWRNNWDRPFDRNDAVQVPFLLPAHSDKIACIGRSQARLLEAWGNWGKCEVTGCPRLDRLIGKKSRKDKQIILIASSRTPGFSAEQQQAFHRAFLDVREYCERTCIQTEWRITDPIRTWMHLESAPGDFTGKELSEVLEHVCAVISMPSTVVVESMLSGIPTAVIDYTNSPVYVPSAWTITAPEHIEPIIQGLLNPDPKRLLHQDICLHDSLECQTPAAPRLIELIRRMGIAHREKRPLPDRILNIPGMVSAMPEQPFQLDACFPRNEFYQNRNTLELQSALEQMKAFLASLQLTELQTKYLQQFSWYKG